MGLKFLQDIVNLDNIQFVNGSGTNAGLINMDGDDLVISNAIGGVFLGTGADDIYIGDGTSSVDIRFEQNMSIYADSSTTRTLTLGGANTNLVLDTPSFSGTVTLGATSINNKLNFTTSNGYINFDYEPSGETGEYSTPTKLLTVSNGSNEEVIMQRLSQSGALMIGHDDIVAIAAGDTWSTLRDNIGWTGENVILSSESGFTSYAFPSNDTTWSNRNTFRFYGGDATAANNGLYIGDGSSTQFIDLDRNLINIGAITATGNLTINSTYPRIFLTDSNHNDDWSIINNDGNFGIYNDTDTSYALTIDGSNNVGIGTTSPEDLLHISADSPVLRLTNTVDSGKSSIEFWDNQSGTSQAGEIFYDDNSNLFGLQGNANGIVFKANNTFPGSELMRLNGSGNLGIGTTSPDTLLHIESTSNTSSPIFTIQNDNDIKLKLGSVRSIAGTAPDTTFIAYDSDLRFIADADSTTEVARITSSGNVGIGTTSPSSTLDVKGTTTDNSAKAINAQDSGGTELFYVRNDGVVSVSNNYLYAQHSSGAYFEGSIKARGGITDDGGTLGLGASGDTSQLNIVGGGNVGIGTTSPDTKLHVDGDLTISGTAPTLRIQDSRNLNNPDWDSVSLGNIEFYSSDTTSPGARVLAEIEAFSNNAAASGPNADLIFKTSAIADSSPQIRLTIGYDGTSTFAGDIVVSGTVDGRDIATDGTKLDTIATNADVTPSWVPSSDPSYLTAHPNISAASSVNNSGLTHIQDITVDSNGHVTGIVSHTLSGSDFVIPGSTAALNEVQCGTYTHTTDIAFVLDTDNNETASFIIKDGVGNSPLTLTETGDLTITGKFVSTFASKASSGAVLVEDSGEIKKRTTAELKTDLSLNNVPNTDATNASNLASGTVPTARLATTAIAKGGTGATTASGARAALGVDAAGTDNSTDVTLAGSLNYITISGQEITRNAIDLAADVTGTLPQTNLPDDMDSDKVKQICVTNHGFALDSNTSAPNYFPLNNLNETRAGDTAQYYARMIAPYAGRVIKVMVRADADIGNSCSVVLTKLSTSGQNPDGLRDEGTDVETVSSVDCSAINTTHTFTFSSGTFGSGDVVNIGLQKNSSNTANVTAVVVWEYTL